MRELYWIDASPSCGVSKQFVPFHNDFPLAVSSLSNANLLMGYNKKLTVVEQCFANIAGIQNIGVLYQIWTYEIYGDVVLICQNTTMRVCWAWIKRYCVLCSKTFSTSSSLVLTSRWFATSRWGRPHLWNPVYFPVLICNILTGVNRCECCFLPYQSLWLLVSNRELSTNARFFKISVDENWCERR